MCFFGLISGKPSNIDIDECKNSPNKYLRTLEHRLQMEHDRQTHTIPPDEEKANLLSRKMDAAQGSNSLGLLRRVQHHLRDVTEVYDRVIQAQRPTTEVPVDDAAATPESCR